eukprot:1143957-Pelagomonas_calceolata.AAC.6
MRKKQAWAGKEVVQCLGEGVEPLPGLFYIAILSALSCDPVRSGEQMQKNESQHFKGCADTNLAKPRQHLCLGS